MRHKFFLVTSVAALLSSSPLFAIEGDAPLTRAEQIADQIDRTGQASPLVEFYRGTDTLTAASERQLVELVRLLEVERDLRIQVGFASADAPALAARRAAAVRKALLALNAPEARVAILPQRV